MRRQEFIFIGILLCAPAAFALNNRSAVSVAGLDTNPCTVASPCRSFGAAIAVTAAGGEIIALDSAGYGPFSVPNSLSISGAPGVHAAITVTSGNGITVSPGSPSDMVSLRNLVLIGAGGAYGIYMTAGVDVTIINCLVRGFTTGGIYGSDFEGHFVVDHCVVLDNSGAYGIYADGGTLATTELVVRHCSVGGNGWGIFFGYHMNATVVDSTVTGSTIAGMYGFNVNSQILTPTQVIVENCTIAHNAFGIYAAATNTGNSVTFDLSQNVIAYNGTATGTAANLGATAAVNSFGNNRFVGNGSDGGPFGPVAFQ